jgi:hypothetical protein
MSVPVVEQALEWLPVLWLVTVHLLIERGRLPRGGWAFRIAAGTAAASVLAASLATGMWPVAALGLLWLRTEVFRHPHATESDLAAPDLAESDLAESDLAAPDLAAPDLAAPEKTHRHQAQPDRPHEIRIQPDWAPGPSPRASAGRAAAAPSARTAQRRRPRSGFTAGLFRYGPPAMAWLFKIEIVVVIIVLLVLFGSWSGQQRHSFNHRANTTLCGLLGGC